MFLFRTLRLAKILLASFLLGCALSASATGDAATVKPAGKQESGVLARVNGVPITETQVLRRLKAVDPSVEDHRSDPNRWARLRESATEAEIRDRLLLDAAHTEGLRISDKELAAALARSRELLGSERYKQMLETRGASEEEYAEFLGNRFLMDKFKFKITADIAVDDGTLREYYRGHKDSLIAPARVRLQTVELADADLAEQVVERLKSGESLAALSDVYAGTRTSEGWVNLRDLPPDLEGQVEAAAANEVLTALGPSGTTRVIRVRERQPPRSLSYEESRGLIRKRLVDIRRQAVLDDWYERTKRQAQVEYR